ncbi:hypothetical protein O181_073473 [Austropuccinia psidii MF-1]|uniref:intramembrane prenyl-peptidase Rce1 n=1 Tax=Austropuccinia psidii MF-1 TaxID=1389203 RepID=A0A9Q3F967_9BASI|nr:hypothetical protein [Austropuccinia psidii MF-1]
MSRNLTGSPSFTPFLAQLASCLAASSYVAVLYLFPSARSRPWEIDGNGRRLDRHHPDILRARLWAATFATVVNLLAVGSSLRAFHSQGKMSLIDTIRSTFVLTGLSPSYPVNYLQYLQTLLQPVILVAILYLGPLYTLFILEPPSSFQKSPFHQIWSHLSNIYTLRAFILGPLFEEIIYRGCITAFNLMVLPPNRLSRLQLIFTCPLWFGLAHLHTVWEIYVNHGCTRRALFSAATISLFQFVYTTMFGWYASFIHLRTGSLLGATLCHSFCNMMGLPPLLQSFSRYPQKRLTITIHYLIGVITFGYLVARWASNPSLFPKSDFWNMSKH